MERPAGIEPSIASLEGWNLTTRPRPRLKRVPALIPGLSDLPVAIARAGSTFPMEFSSNWLRISLRITLKSAAVPYLGCTR